MNVELIYDRQCPHIAQARAHLMRAFAQSKHAARWREWDRGDPSSPAYARRYGSPTILVDGRDVAGEQPGNGSNCCRLYRGEVGQLQGVPSVEGIARALLHGAKGSSGWRSSLASAPGVAVAFLPNLTCPACWPAYAALLGSLGLGFLWESTYLLPLTVTLLSIAVGALAFRAGRRRGYGPFILGLAAAAMILAGKFLVVSAALLYPGIALLVAASIWNAWPMLQRSAACPACESRPWKPRTL